MKVALRRLGREQQKQMSYKQWYCHRMNETKHQTEDQRDRRSKSDTKTPRGGVGKEQPQLSDAWAGSSRSHFISIITYTTIITARRFSLPCTPVSIPHHPFLGLNPQIPNIPYPVDAFMAVFQHFHEHRLIFFMISPSPTFYYSAFSPPSPGHPSHL